jgi:hypothetical protein
MQSPRLTPASITTGNSTGHEQPFNPVFLGGVAPFSGMYGPPLPQQHQYQGEGLLYGRGRQQQLGSANGYGPRQQYQHQQQGSSGLAPRYALSDHEHSGPVRGPAAGSTSGMPAEPQVQFTVHPEPEVLCS